MSAPAPAEFRQVEIARGTRLSVCRSGRAGGPALVMCNGLGGGIDAWGPLATALGRSFQIWRYGYRGLDGSTTRRGNRLTIEEHARDLAGLIEVEQIEAPLILGWSMGVQVMLELHREQRGLARGLVALYGTSGRPLATALDSPLPANLAPYVFGAMRLAGGNLSQRAPRLARSPALVEAFANTLTRLGWAAPELDLEHFTRVAGSWLGQDLGVYAEIFEALAAHDASDLLPRIDTPTLVLGGDDDRFTPLRLSEAMADALPDAEFEVIEGTTHFGLIERPYPIVRAIQRFVRARLGLEI